MVWARETQCLDRTRMDKCLGCPDVMNNIWDCSQWYDQISYDGRKHTVPWNDVKTYVPC